MICYFCLVQFYSVIGNGFSTVSRLNIYRSS